MISKDAFCVLMYSIKEQIDSDRRRSKIIQSLADENYGDSYVVFTTELIDKVVRALELEFKQDGNEYNSDISWFIWEKEFGSRDDMNIYDKMNNIIPTNTPEELYDFMIAEYNKLFQENKR